MSIAAEQAFGASQTQAVDHLTRIDHNSGRIATVVIGERKIDRRRESRGAGNRIVRVREVHPTLRTIRAHKSESFSRRGGLAPEGLPPVLDVEDTHRGKPGQPSVPQKVRELIQMMSRNNPRWGAPRIHGELLKLGIEITEPTVAKHMVRHRNPPSQTRMLPENHVGIRIATTRL